MPRRIEQILEQEGIDLFMPKSVLDIDQETQRAAINLFRFMFELKDPRWSIARAWTQHQGLGVKGIHEEAAQEAKYLGELPSFRNGYASFQSEENLRLICRATVNLSYFKKVEEKFSRIRPKLDSCGHEIRLAKTKKITRGTDREGVTGCPEALYQLQIRNIVTDKYLGRVGFNIHHENGETLVSISNLQGIPGADRIYQTMKQECAEDPFVVLVRSVLTMFPDCQVKGIRNSSVNPAFYNTVFQKVGVNRVSWSNK